MGVPFFYKWLVGKYPSVVSPAKEEPAVDHGGSNCKESTDGIIYDNLYLDMNCIIHPCFHPQDQQHAPTYVCPPTTFDEVFESMFEYMDGLFRVVRPRRLLYLAVDGVAPCAKMMAQRGGRFNNARNAKYKNIQEDLLREKFRAEGKEVLPREISEVSDANVITPGTEFMEKISQALKYYIRARLNSDPGWKDIMVILSDANVPGEGEHKIMSFIRAQRSRESYDPNTRHCVYGFDADLIMLALASHEVHFSILREDVLRGNQAENCIPVTENNSRLTEASLKGKLPKKPYLFLNIWVLREYLELEMKILAPVCEPDIERLIDDFIFICFLLGNDFIPNIPSLEKHECAVDLLIEVYKTTFNKMGGYIVNTDKVKDIHAAYLEVSRLEMFFHELSLYEEKVFLKRYELQEKHRNILRQASENERRERNSDNVEESPDGPDLMAMSSSTQCCSSGYISDKSDITENTLVLRRNLEDTLGKKQRDLSFKKACQHDRIRLGLPGWKSRFYKEAFLIETSSDELGELHYYMAQKYLEGLCWVFQCYFADVPSWNWYYPFFCAPFASDLEGLSRFKISFTVGKPLRPFAQLMATLPPESSSALPKCYSKLMSGEESAIQKLYPELRFDEHRRRYFWLGITKSQFIYEELLLSATKTEDKELTMHEMRRNTIRQEKIFLRNSNALANNEVFVQTSHCSPQKLPIDSATSEIGGWLSSLDDDDGLSDSNFFGSPIKNLEDITNDQAMYVFSQAFLSWGPGGSLHFGYICFRSAKFFNPEAVNPIPRLLGNVRVPDKTVTEADISKRPLWHTYPGSRPPPCIGQRPDTIWKPSSPATPREEHKNAGTGWMGRGKGNAIAAETQRQSRGSSSFDNDGGAYSFRPHGGAGHGGSGQPHVW